MEEKEFIFYGFSFNLIIIGLILSIPVTIIPFWLCIFFFDFYTPQLPALVSLITAAFFSVLYGRFTRKLWKITLTDKVVNIYFGGKLQSRFMLSDLEKIHIRGWNKKKSYKLLRLMVKQTKVVIFVDGSDFLKITGIRGMKVFDELFLTLESYAIEKNYIKKDLKRKSGSSGFKNYYYSQKQNI